MKTSKLKSWFLLARPTFHIVEILPFILGSVIFYKRFGYLDVPVFIIGLVTVFFIVLATYFNGEHYDIAEDSISRKYGSNIFSGGSQVIPEKRLPHKYPRIAANILIIVSVILGLLLQFYFRTGIWTIPLGLLGIILGYFYSKPPLRWVNRGIGEIFIGIAYGWLVTSVAYYLQASGFSLLITLVSLPIAFTIFNVVLLNEYPDYVSDKKMDKKNIIVRLGREKGRYIYTIASILTWVSFSITVLFGIPLLSLYIFIPFFLISLFLVIEVMRKGYLDNARLLRMCGLNIFVNIGVSVSFITGVLVKGVGL